MTGRTQFSQRLTRIALATLVALTFAGMAAGSPVVLSAGEAAGSMSASSAGGAAVGPMLMAATGALLMLGGRKDRAACSAA